MLKPPMPKYPDIVFDDTGFVLAKVTKNYGGNPGGISLKLLNCLLIYLDITVYIFINRIDLFI